jgi:hypothetical protein
MGPEAEKTAKTAELPVQEWRGNDYQSSEWKRAESAEVLSEGAAEVEGTC